MRWLPLAVPLLLALALLLPALVDGKPGKGHGDDEHDEDDKDDDDRGDAPSSTAKGARLAPSLTVQQQVKDTGNGLELRVTLRNVGLATTQDVTLSTNLPDGHAWQVKDKACRVDGGVLTCKLGKMAPQGSRAVVATATGDLGDFITVAQAWAPAPAPR